MVERRKDIDAGKYTIGNSTVRKTGTVVNLLDVSHPDSEFPVGSDGAKFMVICRTHGACSYYAVKSRAWQDFPHPDKWCGQCRTIVADGKPVTVPVVRERKAPAPRTSAPRLTRGRGGRKTRYGVFFVAKSQDGLGSDQVRWGCGADFELFVLLKGELPESCPKCGMTNEGFASKSGDDPFASVTVEELAEV